MNLAFPLASFVSGLLGFAMLIVSLFLILLILVQRGRGGGLTGALGGPGGQSAFGTKAGDLFTRITSFVALGWITLCAFTMWLLGPDTSTQAVAPGPAVSASPAEARTATQDFIDLGTGTGTGSLGESPANNVELTPAITETPAADVPPVPADTNPAATEPAAGDASEAAPGADAKSE
jgi:preprotein translocase subunit SecG